MENVIVLEEPRSVIDNFRNWYKDKVVDTGKAQRFEERIDRKIRVEKSAVKVAGKVATIVLTFCPADGPFGEVCAALATPLMTKLVELKGELTKNVLIGGKRRIEADFIKCDGSSSKVNIPDFKFEDLTNDFGEVKSTIEELTEFVDDGRGMGR